VTLHGFVPDNVLERALSEAHLAINLRYPTMGEGSISQLRIWEHALPSLVSDVGWYATLPPETVAFVRPGHEVADLRRHLQEFLRDPTAFRRRGEQGRRYLVEHHSPEQYAATLLALCAEGLVHRRRSLGYYLAERAGRELSLWCADGREVARPVAEQITRLVA
jgi:glycosyltransferase involved in cell wall biosynthesis